MKTFTTVLLLASVLAITFAQDCDNPLIPLLGLDAFKLDAPEELSGQPYCQVLQDGTARSCCNAEFLGSVQELQDAYLEKLQNFAGKRDKQMKFNSGLIQKLTNAATKLTTFVESVTDETLRTKILADIATITGFISDINDMAAQAAADFADYQSKRATCFTAMLDIQASALCLACDATYVDRGVNSDTLINMATDTCNGLIDACYPYLQAAVKQNTFAGVRKVLDLIHGYMNVTADVSGKKRPKVEDEEEGRRFLKEEESPKGKFDQDAWDTKKDEKEQEKEDREAARGKFYGKPPKDYKSSSLKSKNGIPVPMRSFKPKDEEREIVLPAGCEDPDNIYTCTWICEQAFEDGQVVISFLGAGGELMAEDEDVEIPSEDAPEEEEEEAVEEPVDGGSRRVLVGDAGATWSPAKGEAGTTITVESDPYGVSLTDSAASLATQIVVLMTVVLFTFF